VSGFDFWYHYGMFEIENETGKISFSNSIIYTICTDAADSCGGNVTILHYKSRYTSRRTQLLNSFGTNDTDEPDVVIEEGKDGLKITVYVVVRFGTSMKKAAERIIDHIYTQMEEVMRVRPSKVTVIITGTVSKDIARRHIEFSR
jgi:uncharacterized alkaline shock family protein YloU